MADGSTNVTSMRKTTDRKFGTSYDLR